MNIYIDESGTFAPAHETGKWNCVAAYLSPEDDHDSVLDALRMLKRSVGVEDPSTEVKLGHVPESTYLAFIERLSRFNGVVFAVACDAGMQTKEETRRHQRIQGDLFDQQKHRMVFPEVRRYIAAFSTQLKQISPQLYVQLFCHTYLIHAAIARGVTYFIQRFPNRLGTFRWRIDQKDNVNNVFQETYLKLALPLIQTLSIQMPYPWLADVDYSQFSRFYFEPGEAPTFLRDRYGIEVNAESCFNLGKLLREDFRFQDSIDNEGLQVADLIASGIRRCLRGRFTDNDAASRLLGSLMVNGEPQQPTLDLIGFGPGLRAPVDDTAGKAILQIQSACRPLLTATKPRVPFTEPDSQLR